MKKLLVVVVAFLVVFALVGEAVADDSEFFKGFVSGFASHQMGYKLMSSARGASIGFNSGYTKFRFSGDATCRDKKMVCLSGFAGQMLLSEITLRKSYLTDYDRGVLWWNIIQPVVWVLRNELFHDQGTCGMRTLECAGMKGEYLEIALLFHAWSVHKRMRQKEQRLYFTLHPERGSSLAYNMKF